jgi:methylmalonyl-CoA carboxyltransferase 5S subunit
MKAIEAGADVVDTAISSMSLGPGHNPTESLVAMLEAPSTPPNLDMDRLHRIRDHFAEGPPEVRGVRVGTLVDTDIFSRARSPAACSPTWRASSSAGRGRPHQGGHGRGSAGQGRRRHPPLVTPSSQIVGTQAVFNVLMGRYKVLTGEFADLMLGYYGECLGERNPEVVEIAQAQAKKEPITSAAGRPAPPNGTSWSTRPPRCRATTAPTRTCSPTRCSRVGADLLRQTAPRAPRTSARPRADGR